MKIKDILDTSRGLITANVEQKVSEALKTLIVNKISCLPVIDGNGNLKGIMSDRDLLREVYENPGGFEARKVGDVMSHNILIGLVEDDLDYVMNIMSKNNIRHMPVMSGQNLTGIISIRDVVRGLMHKVAAENRYLKDYIEGKFEGYQ
ncbi:MAG: CBS domain-containing protein [Nitrospirota bacterium]